MGFIETEEIDGGVTVVRLARPPVNALCGALLQELAETFAGLDGSPAAKAVVLWGGESVFAAGADVKEFTPPTSELARKVSLDFRRTLNAMMGFARPTIAAVIGYALGGGLEIALACDFRIAGDNARLGFPEIQLGLIPGGGGTQTAARLIGQSKAKELVFTGRHVKAQEALDIGLVDQVVSPDVVFSTAVERAQRLAAGAVVAMGEAKRAIDEGLRLPLAEGLEVETDAFAATFATNDAARGIESFLADGPGKATFEGN